jgi:cell division protein FtsQ|tara:strand:- start:1580 stop:2335 length:756 start_codon:yes stop_codon:yes gene_type:complete
MNQAKKRKQKQLNIQSWQKGSKYNYFKISVVLMTCFFGYQLLTNILNQPVTSISIEGSFQQVKSNQIEGVISEHLDKGFLNINIADIQKDILKIRWIDKVSIGKRWPGKLEINVFEHTPVARWGERGLLNDKGILFIEIENINHIPDLVYLFGPEGTSMEVAERYFYLRDHLIPLGMNVKRVFVSPRGAWEIKLYNGININFGREGLDDKVNIFIDIARNIISQQSDDIESIDMRYDSGFTILWKKPSKDS